MNWKASLLGALFVALSGWAVGAAIGGKTATKVLSVTVRQTVTVSSNEPSATTTASTSTSTSTSTSGTATAQAPEPQRFLDDYIASQGTEKLNGDASSVSLDNSPTQQQLQGQTYQHAVAFDIGNPGEGKTASFQLPTPGFSRLAAKAIGLETNTAADISFHLTVYKNDDSSPSSVILYQASFHGPSEVHKMDFSTQGATDVLFVWAESSSESSYTQKVFIMADPVLIGGS